MLSTAGKDPPVRVLSEIIEMKSEETDKKGWSMVCLVRGKRLEQKLVSDGVVTTVTKDICVPDEFVDVLKLARAIEKQDANWGEVHRELLEWARGLATVSAAFGNLKKEGAANNLVTALEQNLPNLPELVRHACDPKLGMQVA